MFDLILSCILTAVLTVSILILYLRRTVPDIQAILDDVGDSISEQLSEMFGNPAIKNWMSSMGKKSGEVRSDAALRNKVAEGIVSLSPAIKWGLDKIGITPLEGVRLYSDPTFGPMIKSIFESIKKGPKSSSQGQTVGRM